MISGDNIPRKRLSRDRLIWSGLCFLLAVLAFIAPVWPGNSVEPHLGALLVWIGIIEIYDGFRRSDFPSRKSAWMSGVLSLLMAFLLINSELFLSKALYFFVLLIFAIDAVRYLLKFSKQFRNKQSYWFDLLAGVGNVLLVLALIL